MSRELIGKLRQTLRHRDDEIATGTALKQLHEAFGSHVSACAVRIATDLGVVRGGSPELIEKYKSEEFGEVCDPLFHHAVARRAPVHDQQVFSPDGWTQHPFGRANSKRFGSAHYLVIPILSADGVTGTVHLSRRIGHRAFSSEDLHRASVAGAFLTVGFAERSMVVPSLPRLTYRERQIGILAARGLSNPSIARTLGLQPETVKKTLGRLYLKLEVRGRPQMAALLAIHGITTPSS